MAPNTTRIPEMLGRFFKFEQNKNKDFQITWASILFTIEHRDHNKCLNGEILHFLWKVYLLFSPEDMVSVISNKNVKFVTFPLWNSTF